MTRTSASKCGYTGVSWCAALSTRCQNFLACRHTQQGRFHAVHAVQSHTVRADQSQPELLSFLPSNPMLFMLALVKLMLC